jgi:hypothetical protein
MAEPPSRSRVFSSPQIPSVSDSVLAPASNSRSGSPSSAHSTPRQRPRRPGSGSQFEAFGVGAHHVPEFHVRPASFGSGISAQVEASPAYVLEWDASGCRLLFLNSVEELRREIGLGRRNGNGATTGDKSVGTAGGVERVFVIHGLPVEYVSALRTSLDIDPAFVEAHYGRRRYRPLRWRKDARFAHYEYPELVKGYEETKPAEGSGNGEEVRERRSSHGATYIDLMGNPPVHPISSVGDAALICHASLWMAAEADVLFLDRLLWRDPSSSLRKARRAASVTKPPHMKPGSPRQGSNAWNVQLAEGEEVPALEDALYETLKDAARIGDVLFDILAGLAYDHWLDFFEALGPPDTEPGVRRDPKLLWQVAQSLEQNLDVAKYLRWQRKQVQEASYADWHGLLDRIERRTDLSMLSNKRATATNGMPSLTTGGSNIVTSRTRTVSGNGSGNSAGIANTSSSTSNSDDNPNQASLNRVTYLGGILLPFTVVAAILSMNDNFAPSGPDFWIFWVASVASAAACLLIIYLDQLRGLEVWFEVAANDAVDSLFQPTTVVRTNSSPLIETKTQPNGTIRLQALQGSQIPRVYSNGRNEIVVDVPASSSDGSDVEVLADSPDNPTILVQRRSDGSRPKAWRKQRLGWGGAVKKVVGYYGWRGTPDIQFRPPGLDGFRVKTV